MILLKLFIIFFLKSLLADKSVEITNEVIKSNENNLQKFILYDVNHGEGFNLRRDVYIRMALLIKLLGNNWTLVLPLWDNIPHWKYKKKKKNLSEPNYKQWSLYFDVDSLNKYINVIEFDDFLNICNSVDDVLSLEHFPNDFDEESFNWHEHYEIYNCTQTKYYEKIHNKIVNVLGVDELDYKRLKCINIEGFVSTLKQIIEDNFSKSKTILISNAEVVLHSNYGDNEYWKIRRSMRFNSYLITLANQFRNEYLDSNDEKDKTLIDDDWRKTKKTHGDAIGGNYLAVHLRRGDFAKSRPNDSPTIDCAIEQIIYITKKLAISRVFVASDSNKSEWLEIETGLNKHKLKMFRYLNDSLTDGQLAIIDQIISSRAMFFIGTYDSTFSFRIQEEREILGFMTNTTFNAFCGQCHEKMTQWCKQESEWKILY